MAHQASMSNVGSRLEYEGDDQVKYSQDDVSKASAAHGVSVAGHSMYYMIWFCVNQYTDATLENKRNNESAQG